MAGDDIEDKREIFRQRFAEIMVDMGQNVHKDPETVYLIGSLAAHLLNKTGMPDWPTLKSALNAESYRNLIDTFQQQATEHHENGNKKAAYAIEILAISAICITMRDDEHLASGEELLDQMIADTINLYHKRQAARKAAGNMN